MAGADAAEVFQAILELAAVPGDTVPSLKRSLRPAERPEAKAVAKLIEDLDNDDFETREQASRELAKVADLIRPALEAARAETKSLEVERRIQALLKQTDIPLTSPELLRQLRAIEVLERSASDPAKQVLQDLANGAPGGLLTEQARAALSRLQRRSKQP